MDFSGEKRNNRKIRIAQTTAHVYNSMERKEGGAYEKRRIYREA